MSKTTNQLIAAPKGAVFVWCTPNIFYPIKLAKFLGRTDIIVVSSDTLEHEAYFKGRVIKDVVIDHASRITQKADSVMQNLRMRGVCIK